MSDSSLTSLSRTPSPPSSPSFWAKSQPKEDIHPTPPPLTTRSGRTIKRSAKILVAEEQHPPKRQKMNIPPLPPSPSPSPFPLVNLPHQVVDFQLPASILPPIPEQSKSPSPDPYAHLAPPFEKFWHADAPYPPILPTLPEQSPARAFLTGKEKLYFGYGKDMDITYLAKLFQDEENTRFIAVGKLPGFKWVIGKERRWPKVVEEERGEVWGLIWKIDERGLVVFRNKAEKRGLGVVEREVEMFEKTGPPGFWSKGLVGVGEVDVQVMVGEWRAEDEIEEGEKRKLEGRKRAKVNGGILWGASEGLPEGWKAELRKWVEGPRRAEESGYWGGEGKENGSGEEMDGETKRARLRGGKRAKKRKGKWKGRK